MKRIYTSIDLGSDSVKIVVSEIVNKKFQVLAATSVRSIGIKKGIITDDKMVISSIKLAIKEVEGMLGVRIDKAIVTIPDNDCLFKIVTGKTKIDSDEKEITGEHVVKCLQDSIIGNIDTTYELVTITPIGFKVDDRDGISDPKGLLGDLLEVKAVIALAKKENIYRILNIFKECNVEVIDISFAIIGDYFELRNSNTDREFGAIVNIGSDITSIGIFNKGILIKSDTLEVGSRNVDNDIAFIYKVDRNQAKGLKENFAISNHRYADSNDVLEIVSKNGEKLTINQYEISQIVESRLEEILKLAKNQINILTKREISYIIVTGGITEMAGFQYVVDNILGRIAFTNSIHTMGARHNKYSSALGLCKGFHDKLELRDKDYSMFDERRENDLISTKKKMVNLSNDSIINKVFGYFFDN